MTFGSNVLPKRFGAGTTVGYVYGKDCRCGELTEAEKKPGAVIEVCDLDRCQKSAQAKYLAYVDAQGNPHFFKP